MKVYEAVANAFVKEGTSAVFGLLGDGQITWWSAMARYPGVKIIDARDEGAALAMAEGWARATGKVGVCSVTHGPGISRIATSLITAARSRTPTVVYASKTAFNDDNALQFLDQSKLVNATGAGYIEVLTPSFAENAVRQAFYEAKLHSRPIVLCVPLDVQTKECDCYGNDYEPSSCMFAGQQDIRPAVQRLNDAVKIIANCKKPVILLGRGAMLSETTEAADQLAKRIGALIATTLLAKGTLAAYEYHAGICGQLATRGALKLFEQADCVIAVGASLSERTIGGGYVFPNASVIQIDVMPHVLMGNYKGADCYVQGHAALTLREIDDALREKAISITGYRTEAVRKTLQDADQDPTAFEIEDGTIDPRDAVRLLDERLPSSVGMVTGNGHFFAFPVMHMKKPRAPNIFIPHFGCIGQAFPVAIGAAVAVEKPIVCLEGDGSAMQNIQELDTAARLGLKVLFTILNDQAYASEYHKLNAKGLDVKLSAVRTPDFGALGREFGCRGSLARNAKEVVAGVDEFLANDGPMVLDIRISRSVLSIPFRRLIFGQDA